MSAYDPQRALNVTGGTIALAMTGLLGATIFALVRLDVPPDNQNALLILIGALTTNVTAIIAFFFGTNQASRAKDATISTMAATTAAAMPPDKSVPIGAGETVAVKSTEPPR